MPAQLSTILYISNYKESTSSNFFISSATGIIRLDENDSIQTFNLTVFYPIDSSIPCYVPKLADGQVLSINNCKFSLGNNNEIDVRNIILLYFIFIFYLLIKIFIYKYK